MNPEAFNAVSENLYRAVLMMIQYITMIAGITSALFVFVCIFSAVFDWFTDKSRTGRPQRKAAGQ